MNPGDRPTENARSSAPAVPGPGLLAACALALALPVLLAALLEVLPGVLRLYLTGLPLPGLVLQFALVFAIFLLPLFKCPPAGEVNSGLIGLWRGLALGLLGLPFVMVARLAAPAPLGAVLLGCALVAATAAGAAAAGAAFRARGLALAVVLCCLPGLFGCVAPDVYPPLAWIAGLSPFVAIERALAGTGGWWMGVLPGLGLLAAGFAVRGRGSEA